jgi:hypothetical protein
MFHIVIGDTKSPAGLLNFRNQVANVLNLGWQLNGPTSHIVENGTHYFAQAFTNNSREAQLPDIQ